MRNAQCGMRNWASWVYLFSVRFHLKSVFELNNSKFQPIPLQALINPFPDIHFVAAFVRMPISAFVIPRSAFVSLGDLPHLDIQILASHNFLDTAAV